VTPQRVCQARARAEEEDLAEEDQARAWKHFRKSRKGATSQERTAVWRAAVSTAADRDDAAAAPATSGGCMIAPPPSTMAAGVCAVLESSTAVRLHGRCVRVLAYLLSLPPTTRQHCILYLVVSPCRRAAGHGGKGGKSAATAAAEAIEASASATRYCCVAKAQQRAADGGYGSNGAVSECQERSEMKWSQERIIRLFI
jgi:hypothetical protein